jgi:hypothetical protein
VLRLAGSSVGQALAPDRLPRGATPMRCSCAPRSARCNRRRGEVPSVSTLAGNRQGSSIPGSADPIFKSILPGWCPL